MGGCVNSFGAAFLFPKFVAIFVGELTISVSFMKAIYILPLVIALCLNACTSPERVGDNASDALCALDSLSLDNSSYVGAKERRISSLRDRYAAADDEDAYRLAGEIYGEYYNYNLDSARVYALKRTELAPSSRLEALARLDAAKAELSMGQESDAYRNIELALRDTVYPDVRLRYYDIMASDAGERGQNPLKWHKLMAPLYSSDSVGRRFNESNIKRLSGDYVGAERILTPMATDSSRHVRAIARYLMGVCALEKGDTVAAVTNLAGAAVEDLRTPVRDYQSLLLLSGLLLKQGDTERAYRYIRLASSDFNASKSAYNIVLANKLIPDIMRSYEAESRRQAERTRNLLCGICLLSVGMAVILCLALKARRKLARAVKEEKRLSAELSAINDNLARSNAMLKESDHVKVTYILQYLTLCSQYIDALDSFRGKVSGAVRTKGLKGVEQLIAKADDNKMLKSFYSGFDHTFLMLYPDFIESFNKLVDSTAQLHLGRDGALSNETRVFALIRLGITDSAQIAAFLRLSVTTVYNYRVKMRNAALIARDEFEKTVSVI